MTSITSRLFPSAYSAIRKLSLPAFAIVFALLPVAAYCADNLGQPGKASLAGAAELLGAANIKSIQFSGAGHWFQFGQSPSPGSAWPQFDVSSYTATINYETPAERVQITRRQALEPGRLRPDPVEQKPDQYVSAGYAWNLAPPPGAAADAAAKPQGQPAALEERVTEIWTTPQGFLKAAQANGAKSKPVKNGIEVSFTAGSNRYVGIINAGNQLEHVKTWIDSPILGDTLVEYSYSDYRDFNGVLFPSTILRKQGGHPVLALAISSVTPNAEANIAVPSEISVPAPAIAVTSEELAPGVFYIKGGTHHSVAIEQRDHIVLVEAPLNEARSEAVIAQLKAQFPGKPIRFVVNTHQHFDHSGGLRTYVAEGSTIVTHKLNQAYYKKVWATPHAINPDRLALSNKPAKFKTFDDKLVLNDGNRSIEIHQIAGSGHNDAFALVYLPAEKILVEADAYTPAAAGAALPTKANPYNVNLYDNIKRLNLDVVQIAALHGPRITTLDDLRAAIGVSKTASN